MQQLVFKGLNEMFSLGISEQELMTLGKQIGADVPYCIKGGTMLSEGIGEILTTLNQMPKTHIFLLNLKSECQLHGYIKTLDLTK